MRERLSLRQRLLLFFAAIAIGGLGSLIGGAWLGLQRMEEAGPAASFLLAGTIAGFGLLCTVTWVWFLFDEHVGRALGRLAAGMRAQAHADKPGAFDPGPGQYLGDLGPAAEALATALADTRDELAGAVQRETAQIAEEKARLEVLLADVPAAVLLCNERHQIVFYNGPAVDMLGAMGGPGLNRPLFSLLREAPIRHAHERLKGSNAGKGAADFMVATTGGDRILSGRMRPMGGGQGYVLTLRDVTADIATHGGQDRLLAEIFDRVRRPAAGIQTTISVLSDHAEPDPRLTDALIGEAKSLVTAITELGQRYEADRGRWSPLPATRSDDLTDGFSARIGALGLNAATAVPGEDAPLILRCDGFEIVALMAELARQVARAGHADTFALTVGEDGAGAIIDLSWKGPAVTIGVLDTWLGLPVDPTMPDLTGQAILANHATECWPEAAGERAMIRLPLRAARRAERNVAPLSRTVTYDFNLLFAQTSRALADTSLRALTYVVFDTETTGLLPDEGDEIVQIAGVRLVNGRRIVGEVFDALVNPGRSIPPGATAVHGITDEMVEGAASVGDVLTRFHGFAEEAVLIAHNAPFDMTFLRRREGMLGRRFDHPVLDTVLLSAVVYGQTENHSLDALVERLSIRIPEEARHTALGDTIATADAFLKLLPMLEGKGIHTFGDLLAEVRKHGRLLKDLNA
ncbi:MAG: DNA polymerase III subunit epsilon [Rhodobacteraceae bacterium]|nr:DNA polymerase III subunit epsilon [Paracoccaceae bacterium]